MDLCRQVIKRHGLKLAILLLVIVTAIIVFLLTLPRQTADPYVINTVSEPLPPLPNSSFVKTGEPIEEHYFVSENDEWQLYLKPETLSVLVRNKETGEYMVSTVSEPVESDLPQWKGFYQSGVILEYIRGTNLNTIRADFINTEHIIDIATVGNGFWADVNFPEISISYRLIVELDEHGIKAEIPQNSIKEGDETFTTAAFYVFPFLGSVYDGELEGYMFIPDGQGALITLQHNEGRYAQPFSVPVYGSDAGIDDIFSYDPTYNDEREILMPVFGMVHTETDTSAGIGFIGIIEEGDFFSRIEAYPNGALTAFDWITSRFVYRQIYTQPTGQTSGGILQRTERPNYFDIKIRFDFVSGENANYTGLALRYRDYLTEKGTFDYADDTDFRVQVDFMGFDKKDWTLFKLNVNMTTFEQAAEILEQLNASGVDNILSVYKGWQQGGVYGGLPTKGFNPAGNLGGNRGLQELYRQAERFNTSLYLGVNPIIVNKDTDIFESMNAVKRVTRRTYDIYLGNMVYNYAFMLTPRRSLEIARESLNKYIKNGVTGVLINDVATALTSHFDRGVYYDRGNTADIYRQLVSEYSENIELLLDSPYAYLWGYANALVNMPIDGSDYIYTEEEVPFLAIALSGQIPFYAEYTNFQANQNRFFLQLIEQGAFPSFYITWEDPFLLQTTNSNYIYSSRFTLYEPKIIEMYHELEEIASKTRGASINGHERKGRLVCVTYDNGVKIYLNYGEHEAVWSDSHSEMRIEGMGYVVTENGIPTVIGGVE